MQTNKSCWTIASVPLDKEPAKHNALDDFFFFEYLVILQEKENFRRIYIQIDIKGVSNMEVSFRLYQLDISSFSKYRLLRLPGLIFTVFFVVVYIVQALFLVLLTFWQGTASTIIIFMTSNLLGILVAGA